ncbi:terminase large subunit domain-containing protein [Gracilimonas tropica]|uniref:phage terminase large subunit family protein n=1 Tax=Gracilimonas tropica TaxID=454600 RepID=UPI0003724D16|nr:terminase family protein [Gracilimonas tropica]
MEQPHFLPYQKAWLDDKSDIKIWEKSRRIGATYVQSYEDFEFGMETGRKVWFSSADESAAREYIDYIAIWCSLFNTVANFSNGEVIIDEKKDIKALQVELPTGATINALTSNPKRFRSKGGKAVWDEAAWHDDPDAMWRALEPATMWGDPIRILSTHNGKRTFYRLIEKVKSGEMKGSVHTVTIVDAVNDGLVDKIYGRQTTQEERQEWLDIRKSRCIDEIQWLQEYMCLAVDEADAFLSYEMIAAIEDSHVLWNNGIPDTINGDLYLGVDIARKKHFTVFWLEEKIGPMKFTRVVKKLQNATFRAQKQILYKYLALPKLRRCCIDATGLGMQLAEEAQQDYGRFKVEPVNFTNSVKEDLAYNLRRSVEEKSSIIPESQEIREDLHAVRKVVTKSNNVRFDVDSSIAGHADHFWAFALCEEAAKTYKGQPSVASTGTLKGDNMTRNYFDGIPSGF